MMACVTGCNTVMQTGMHQRACVEDSITTAYISTLLRASAMTPIAAYSLAQGALGHTQQGQVWASAQDAGWLDVHEGPTVCHGEGGLACLHWIVACGGLCVAQ